MDDFYADQESQYDEMMRDDILDEDLNIEQKIYEF